MADKDNSADPARVERQRQLGLMLDEMQAGNVTRLPVRETRLTPDETELLRLYRGLPPQRREGFNLALTMLRLGN